MVSGIGTSSGFEERIRFSEIEIVDSNAIDSGVMNTVPEGNYINGWDVNVAAVRITSVKRNIRHHRHAEFLLRVKRKGELEHFVARRYGDFAKLHKRLRTELPGRVLPSVPKKNKTSSTATGVFSGWTGGDDSDASSISTVSTRITAISQDPDSGLLSPSPRGHARSGSARSIRSMRSNRGSPRTSADGRLDPGSGSTPTPDNQEVSTCRARIGTAANLV